MDPQSVTDVEMIRWTHYFYFAGGITVLVLGAIGTIMVVLGVLKMKFLKPFKNRYPYEEFKSFDEFTSKKPAKPGTEPLEVEDVEERLRKKEEETKNAPPLTWDNAAEEIPSLSAQEYKTLKETADIEGTSSDDDSETEIAEKLETEEIPAF